MLLKSKIHLLFNKNTTEIKQDSSIVKLNISQLLQAGYSADYVHENTKKSLIIHYVIKYCSLNYSIDVKIV